MSAIEPLATEWAIRGYHAHIEQQDSELLFTNEHGDVSRGEIVSETQIRAIDWGNLLGTLSDNDQRIDWANGTVWTWPLLSPSEPDVSGFYLINGQLAQIRQMEYSLTFVNERGEVSEGTLASGGPSLLADRWLITAEIVGSQINWSNGTTWTKTDFVPPDLSRFWTIGDAPQSPKIQPNDGELFLTNESGQTTRAIFQSSTEILALQWGVVGTLTNGNTTIEWDNGTVWNAAP